MPYRCLIKPLVFLFTGFCQGWLWVLALRVMQLDTEPPMVQCLDFATNKPHPFLMGSLRASIWLRQYT
jgi:hypothetical protein